MENKYKCLEAVPGLILMLQRSGEPKNQMIAARAVGNISNTTTTKIPMIEMGVLPPLIALLQHEDDGVKEAGMTALMYIANIPETKCLVVVGGILPPLFHLLEHSADRMKENTSIILASLVLMEENHIPMIEACSFPVLLNGIASGSPSFREKCVFLLSTLSYVTSSREHLIAGGVVKICKPLLDEATTSSQLTRELAVALIANICHLKSAQVKIVNENLMPLLTLVAQHEAEDKSDLKQRVGWILQNVRHLVRRSSPSGPPAIPPMSGVSTESIRVVNRHAVCGVDSCSGSATSGIDDSHDDRADQKIAVKKTLQSAGSSSGATGGGVLSSIGRQLGGREIETAVNHDNDAIADSED